MTNEGKLNIFGILLILLLLHTTLSYSSPATLRGGLLYAEAVSTRAIYVNQNTFTVTRRANTAFMQTGAQSSRDITRLYTTHCNRIKEGLRNVVKPLENIDSSLENTELATTTAPSTDNMKTEDTKRYIVAPETHSVLHAPNVCHQIQARLPEIRSIEEREKLRTFAIQQGVKTILAGIKYDPIGPLFRFISDQANARWISPFNDKMEYGGTYHEDHTGQWEWDKWLRHEALTYPVIYANPNGQFVVRISNERQKWEKTKIICEQDENIKTQEQNVLQKNPSYEPDMLTMLAHHNCLRDLQGIVSMTQTIEDDIRTITRLDLMLNNTDLTHNSILPRFARPGRSEDDTGRQNRTRRAPLGPLGAIGLIAGGTALVNAVSSSFTDSAPLSFIGQGLGKLFGLRTDEDTLELQEQMVKTATQVQTLQINNLEILEAVNNMQSQINKYETLIDNSYMSMMALTIELDLKAMARHIQMLLTATLNKWANIFVAASSGTVSPYALTPDEFQLISEETKRSRDLELTTTMEDIQMSCVVINNTLHLIFHIPILEQDQLFNFYRVDPMPVFSGTKTLLPEIDAQHIAISKSGSSYITLTSDEFSQCTTNSKNCQASSIISPMTADAHCVITTYTSQTLSCPLVETNRIPAPSLHINENTTIYSVPKETTLYVKCRDSKSPTKFKDESVTIKGMGQISFKPGCAIVLPGGEKFYTPTNYAGLYIDDAKLYNLIRAYPIPTNVTIKKMVEEQIPLTHLTLEQVSMPSWEQFTAETFHPIRAMPFFTKMFITIVTFLIIALIFRYLYKNDKLPCCRRRDIPYVLPPEGGNRTLMEQMQTQINNLRQQLGRRISTHSNRSSPDLHQMEEGPALERNVHFSTDTNTNAHTGGILKRNSSVLSHVNDFDTSRDRISHI